LKSPSQHPAQQLETVLGRAVQLRIIATMSADPVTAETPKKSGWLDRIERLGNRLPHPMTLFIAGAILVLVLSQIADSANWSVDKTVMAPNAEGVEVKTVVPVTAKGLLTGDGAYWALDNLVKNFTGFAPLGVVLVGMLGIGVAECAPHSDRQSELPRTELGLFAPASAASTPASRTRADRTAIMSARYKSSTGKHTKKAPSPGSLFVIPLCKGRAIPCPSPQSRGSRPQR
jgi:hypothetical protein